MRILRHLLLLAATAAASHAAHAATPAGTLDPTFGDGGKRTIPLDIFPVTRGSRALLGPGGNIYAVGTGDPSAQPNDSGIVLSRLTPAGAIDTSFGYAGSLVHQPMHLSQTTVTDAVFDLQDRLLVAGIAAYDNERIMAIVCRFDAEGALDMTFGNLGNGCLGAGGGANIVTTLSILQHRCDPAAACIAGMRILLAGTLESITGQGGPAGFLVGANLDGTALDASFGGTTQLLENTRITGLSQNAAGKVAMVGAIEAGAGNTDVAVLRFDPQGQIEYVDDLAFNLGPEGSQRDSASSVVMFDDGSMIVGGQAQVSDSFYWPLVFKLLADGDGDPAFDGGPFADAPWPGALTYSLCDGCSTAVVHDLEVMADGRIVLAGARTDITDVDNPPGTLASASNFFVLRLLPDGTPDKAFGSPDAPVRGLSLVDFDGADGNSHDEAFSLVLDGNGVLLAGHARAADPDPDDDNQDVYDLAVARIGNGDGLFSSGFESPP